MGRTVPDDAYALRYAPNVVRHDQRGTSTTACAMGRYVFHRSTRWRRREAC